MSNPVSDQSSPESASASGSTEALKAKLAAMRAVRAEVEAGLKLSEDEQLLASLETEERALREAKARVEAKRTLGNKWAEVATPMGLVIVKRSGTAAFRAMQDTESMNIEQMEQFVSPCIFYPEPEAASKILAELPAAIPGLFNAIAALMGAKQAETSKK